MGLLLHEGLPKLREKRFPHRAVNHMEYQDGEAKLNSGKHQGPLQTDRRQFKVPRAGAREATSSRQF